MGGQSLAFRAGLHPELDTTGAGDAGSLVGRLAVLSTWLELHLNRYLNMFTLIALGTGTAYLYSLVATVAPNLFPVNIPGTWRKR